MFYFTSSIVNMFRTLIHPKSGACNLSIVSQHWSCVLVSVCVGVSVWLGCGGIRVADSASMDGFVSHLAVLAGWRGGREFISKSAFGLPGDCSEICLPFL